MLIFKHGTQVVDFSATAQVVNHIIYEIQQLAYGLAHAESTYLRIIDHLGIQAEPHGVPLVLLYKVIRQQGSPQAHVIEPGQFRDESLAEGDNRHSIVNRPRHIEDTELNSIEKGMWAYIPPDFFAIIDTAGFDEGLHIGVKIPPRGEDLWYPTAREGFPHHSAIGFEAGKTPGPKW